MAMTPREAGIQAFYADESTSNTLQGLNAAFDAYEAAAFGAIRAVRDGYASQARFADVEAAAYFREFVRRIDAALSKAKEA